MTTFSTRWSSGLLTVCCVSMGAGCSEEPILPAVEEHAIAFAKAIGEDSLQVSIVNSHDRALIVFLCATKLQRFEDGAWSDMPDAGPAGCITGVSEPIVFPSADTTFTIGYRFGTASGTRRAVLSVGLGGTPGHSRRMEPTDSLPTSPLGVEP